MCNSCIHAPVCGKCKAIGGQVGKCEHYAEEKRSCWVPAGRGIRACKRCNHGIREHMACVNHYCPNCGAKMAAK